MGKYDNNPIIEGRYDAYGRKTYWADGHTGAGVTVGIIDDFSTPHGHQMASVGRYIAPDAEIIKLDMKGDYYSMIDCVNQAVGVGINILSISRSVDFDTNKLHDAIIKCRNAGVVIFCSAGNTGDNFVDSVDIKRYPAAYPETISVLALDNTFAPQSSSSHGSTGWCTGFGQNVLVRNQDGEETLVSGTSPVTPAMAFTLALHWSKMLKETGKHMTPAEAEAFVIAHCVDWNTPGKDNMTGYGFFTLDSDELSRVKLMITDANNDGLANRVERIKVLMAAGATFEQATAQVSKDYYIVAYEQINGVNVPIYGGRKPY